MKKRIISMLLATVMVAGMLVACGGPDGPGEFDGEYKNVTITMSGKQGATDDWGGTVMVQQMKEKFGVTINCEPFMDDVWETKFNLMMVDDDLPDLIVNSHLNLINIEQIGVEDGYLLKIDEYLEHMPNLQAFFTEHPEYRTYCTASDGHIYGLLGYNDRWLSNLGLAFIKTSWLENVGMDYPETPDELYEVLKAFRDQDANGNGDPNDEIPMMWASTYSRTPEQVLMPMFGIYPANGGVSLIRGLDDNGKVYVSDVQENYKAYLKFLNKLWEEGLIYNESYTVSIDAQRELTKNDRVGIFSDASSYAAAGNGNPLDALEYQYFGGLTSDYAKNPVLTYGYNVTSGVKVAISSKTKYPAEICRMVDYFFSEEGQMYGWRGDVKSYTDEIMLPGTDVVYDVFRDNSLIPDGYSTWEVYRHKKQVINSAFQIVNINTADVDWMEDNLTDKEGIQQLMEAGYSTWVGSIALRIGEANIKTEPAFPLLTYGADSDRRNQLSTDINNYIKTMKAQFITGELDIDANWDKYVSELNKMGLQEFIDIEQRAYDRLFG